MHFLHIIITKQLKTTDLCNIKSVLSQKAFSPALSVVLINNNNNN